jgi:hypothetical protein
MRRATRARLKLPVLTQVLDYPWNENWKARASSWNTRSGEQEVGEQDLLLTWAKSESAVRALSLSVSEASPLSNCVCVEERVVRAYDG